jgi:hypothetical protein
MPARLVALLRPHTARERFAFVQTTEGWVVHLLVDNRTHERRNIPIQTGNQIWDAHIVAAAEATASSD